MGRNTARFLDGNRGLLSFQWIRTAGEGRSTRSEGTRPYSGSVRVAALDLGSNSFHLLVVEGGSDGSFVTLAREKEILGLGEVVARLGTLPPETYEQAAGCARRLIAIAEAAGATRIVGCATSALRDAFNGPALLAQLEAETGVGVRVLSGEEEAALVFRAVQASVVIDPGPAVCLDLGGGSLEMAVGDAVSLQWAGSVGLGVGRITAELVRRDPPSSGDLRRLADRVAEELSVVRSEVLALGPQLLIGTSGTMCDLGRMAAVQRGGSVPAGVHQLVVGRQELKAIHRRLVRQSLADRRRLPGLDARRAAWAPAGSLVALAAMDAFGLDELTVGEWALREGIVLGSLARTPAAAPGDGRSLRRDSVVELGRRCRFHEAHARHVAKLATELFDVTALVHRLGAADRELLELGALLHDVGEHVSRDGHHRHGAYLIEHGRLRGLPPADVDVLASLCRFHRRGEPKPAFPPFGRLSGRRRDEVRALVGILRVADALDRSRAKLVRQVTMGDVARGSIRLVVAAAGEAELELSEAQRRAALLARCFGRRMVISPATTAAAAGRAWSAVPISTIPQSTGWPPG